MLFLCVHCIFVGFEHLRSCWYFVAKEEPTMASAQGTFSQIRCDNGHLLLGPGGKGGRCRRSHRSS